MGLTQLAFATTYDVQPGGAYPTIQSAVDVMAPGDTVLVHAGTYTDYSTVTYSGSQVRVAVHMANRTNGTAALPYTIAAAPGDVVILDGGPNSVHSGIWIRNSNYVTVRGFVLRNFTLVQTSAFSSSVIGAEGGQYVTIQGNDIAGSGTTPQESYDIGMGNSYFGKIIDNQIQTSKYYSIVMSFPTPQDSPGSEISRNRIEVIGSGARTLGMRPARIDHLQILDNYMLVSSGSISSDSYAMQLRDMTEYVVAGNIIEGWPNAIHNFDYSGRNEQGWITNNTFVNMTSGAILSEECSGCRIGNNIFKNVTGFGINCTGNNADFGVANEVFNNLYVNVSRDELFVNPYAAGAGCNDLGNHVRSDPQFSATGAAPDPYYSLLSASPAIDGGDNNFCHTTPLDGDSSGTATCDIGACEFGQGCLTTWVPVITPIPTVTPTPTPTGPSSSETQASATSDTASNSEISSGCGAIERGRAEPVILWVLIAVLATCRRKRTNFR